MPRTDRTIQPLTLPPAQLTPDVFMRIINEKIQEINFHLTSLDTFESEVRGEDGLSPSVSADMSLNGNRITHASPSQSDTDYVTRGELRRNSIYSTHAGQLVAKKSIDASSGITVPLAIQPDQALPLSQVNTMMSDVVHGPASSTNNAIARWDGTTGRLLKDSSIGAAITSLTDNSGGTANDTVQALPDPADTPLTADALRDDLVANLIPVLRNDFADLTAKVNAILTALRAVYVITP